MLFRKEVIERREGKLSGDVLVIPDPLHRYSAIAALLWIVVVAIFLNITHYSDTQSVRGWLEPSNGVIQLYSPSSGATLTKLFVAEGQSVKKGDILFALSNRVNLNDGQELRESAIALLNRSKIALESKAARDRLSLLERKAFIEYELEAAKNESKILLEHVDSLNEFKSILFEQKYRIDKLKKRSYISLFDSEQISKEMLELNNQVFAAKLQQSTNALGIERLKYEYESMPNQIDNAVENITAEIYKIDMQLLQYESERELFIHSPIAGTVSNLQVNIGQSLDAKVPTLTILPSADNLIAKILVPVNAAGFVEKGQKITVQYTAFPYQKYGSYDAFISEVPATTLLPGEINGIPIRLSESVYVVSADLVKESISDNGRTVPLLSGMTFSAKINLGTSTLASKLLGPLYRIGKG